MIEFKKKILDIVQAYKEKYIDKECADEGWNGPYMTKQLAIRNTAHWIISFCVMYKMTGDEDYKMIVKHFSEYICRELEKSENYSAKYLVYETVNLVGLAWIIEGLVRAGMLFDDTNLYEAAKKIFLSQKYYKKIHLWHIVDVDRTDVGTDIAFNHNLWFAMAGAKLCSVYSCDDVEEQVLDFMKHISEHFMIYPSGLISHYTIGTRNMISDAKQIVRKYICQLTHRGIPWKEHNFTEYERAYHLFSVYAFACIYMVYPDLNFFKTKKFEKIKNYGLNYENYLKFDYENKYAYFYNSPAYEYPFVQYVFGKKDENVCQKLYEKHCHDTYDNNTSAFTKGTDDVETLNARVYEIMQLYEMEIN